MIEEKNLTVKPGQKFMYKRSNTIYIVKNVKDDTVTLESENGEVCTLMQADEPMSAGFEPLYDWLSTITF